MSFSRLSSLRVHLLVIVTLAVSPALVMVAHMSWEARHHAELRTENDARRLAEYIAGQQRQAVDSTRRTVQQIAASFARLPGNESANRETLRRRLLQTPALSNLGRVDASGIILHSAAGPPRSNNVAGETWFQRVMETSRFWLDNRSSDPATDTPTIVCAFPILPTNRPCEGVVFGSLNLGRLHKDLPHTAESLVDSTVDIFNCDGRWLAGNAPESAMRVQNISRELRAELPRTGETRVFTERFGHGSDAVLRVVHFIAGNSPQMESYIVVSVPLAKVRAEITAGLMSDSVLLSLVALLSLLLAWLISERLVIRRTRALVTATEKLAAGDRSARTGLPHSTSKNDEIGELARKFDSMATQLESEHHERQQLEEQVRIAQKMEAMGLLAGGVAHDFNNLLQVISGSTALAQQSISANDPAGHHLDNARQAADRAAQLTRQLLAMSRQQPLNRVAVELNELVSSLLQMIRRVIGTHIEVTFSQHIGPAWINADRGQIEQILLNLCLNARDAMPDGGQLELHARRRVVAEADLARPGVRPGAYFELSVRDTGCGIAPENLPRIFDPFFTTKAKDRGTGLGLSVVYGIVRQHEGHIHVDSEVGFGATFRVLLPGANPPSEVITLPSPEEPTVMGSETVLVVEDEELVRELTIHILEGAGYHVLAAANGVEACEQFTRHRDKISLVVMDAIMPRMGGREATLKIREMKPEVAVLFCSGYGGAAMELNHALPKNEPLLAKPYQPAELLRRVRAIMASSWRREPGSRRLP